MSTRACYRFIPDNGPNDWPGVVTVYKHHDGYPTGAAKAIEAALDYAWQLPRFEADEFAAAFVAANKRSVSSIRNEYELEAQNAEKKSKVDIEYAKADMPSYYRRLAKDAGNYAGGGVRLVPFEGLSFALSTSLRSSVAGPGRRGISASMENSMKVLFIPVSQNAKAGLMPVSIIERASCWPGCALYENGCYAETGALAIALGSRIPRPCRRVLVGVLRKGRSASARSSVALRPSRRLAGTWSRDRRQAPRRARRR